MGKIVAKFGGSSLSDAGQFVKVRQIIEMDTRRCYVVPSAPGKRFDGDEKVTDLLYRILSPPSGRKGFYARLFAGSGAFCVHRNRIGAEGGHHFSTEQN